MLNLSSRRERQGCVGYVEWLVPAWIGMTTGMFKKCWCVLKSSKAETTIVYSRGLTQ